MKVGQTFGAWEVVEYAGGRTCLCLCKTCGKKKQSLRVRDLEAGRTIMCRSCSFSSADESSRSGKVKYEYNSWCAMIQRCCNPKSKDYPNYGGRGISVFPLWRDSFEAFYLMVGPRPAPEYTLERIDYSKGYVPGNVTWATRQEQVLNKRDNVNLTINGETKTVSQWVEHEDCVVSRYTVYGRLKRGWEPKEAVFAPPRKRKEYGQKKQE